MNTTYFLNCAAGNIFNTKTSPALPKTYYIGLSTSAPAINGSGWRSYYRSYMDRQRPLWIVAEDPSAGRRLWITQERSQLSITVGPMDHERRNHGHAHTISCRNQADMCATLYKLFESAAGAA